ncbi:MAG TPA: transglycosylase domain-containing protein [Candidatus Paceibacterota bacterium]|nr:transglycosylase domain-containing protein [Candidatus Paceibacterota bacterium]
MRKNSVIRWYRRTRRHIKAHTKRDILILVASAACIFASGIILWISSFQLPDLSSFDSRKVTESTKIYDRTGTVLLYDLNQGVKRTVLPSSDISPLIKNATVAIEDEDFYHHGGIKISSIIRAVLANIVSGGYSQGGSTITQQVVKNTLLTGNKSISRKIKEWVLAVKLDKALPKDTILSIYLNENPYGGSIYGVEEASRQFFAKDAKDVTLAEAAYLAAIPQATTYYSPYGKNTAALETRKNLVLQKMLDLHFIDKKAYDDAKAEKVQFQPQDQYGIKAPHFVFFVKQYLESILGQGSLANEGYKVITTIDADLQAKAEDLVKTTAFSNEKNFNASNAALVAIDPHTGDIVSMVGSRDYFDKEIDGQFNAAISPNRQPGSTMKPIIYSEAFIKGYTPDTVLFDLPTEFSTQCMPSLTDMYASSTPISPDTDPKSCYNPDNYDGKFRGPLSLRDSLAQSINVTSVKTLYLAGIKDSLGLAKDMGITSLTNPDQYGLTLVLGGGEISLLEMTNAYGVFANDGVRVPYRSVLSVKDSNGNDVRLPSQKQSRVLPANIAETISDILSDNTARTPAYGPNSVLYFPTRDVAVKTGTTNDSRDAWTVGYTPNLVIGVWAGNNDNSPMVKKVAGQIVAPMWSSFMKTALAALPDERFVPPTPADPATLKPVMKGIWQGGQTYTIDTVSGKLATQFTPAETRKEVAIQSVHDILYWVDKTNPLGPQPIDPSKDPQFIRWETPVRIWAQQNGYADQSGSVIPTQSDDVHTQNNTFSANINNIDSSKTYDLSDSLSLQVGSSGPYPIAQATLYINDTFVQTITNAPFVFRFSPNDIPNIKENNVARIVAQDTIYNRREATASFKVALDR